MKAIIFDFDGVLADTREINYSICKTNNPSLSMQEFEDHHNGNVLEKPLFTVPNDFHALQKERFTQDALFPLLNDIRVFSDKYLLFVVSSSREDNIEHFLELGNVKSCFKKFLAQPFILQKYRSSDISSIRMVCQTRIACSLQILLGIYEKQDTCI